MAPSFNPASSKGPNGSSSPTVLILPGSRFSPYKPNEVLYSSPLQRNHTNDLPSQKFAIARGYTLPRLAPSPIVSHLGSRAGFSSPDHNRNPDGGIPLAVRDQIREATAKVTSPKRFTQGGNEHGVKVHDFAQDMEVKPKQKKKTLSLKRSTLFNRRSVNGSKRAEY